MTKQKNIRFAGIAIVLAAFVFMMISLFGITGSGTGNGGSAIWNRDFQQFADNMVSDCNTDKEKSDTFAVWITNNIEYDSDYQFGIYQYTDVSKVIENKTGVCYDYSNVYAALCRSQNIPCHIVDGVSDSGYHHSWNRVYLDGVWYDVDLTNDAAFVQKNEGKYFGYQTAGEDDTYRVTKIY